MLDPTDYFVACTMLECLGKTTWNDFFRKIDSTDFEDTYWLYADPRNQKSIFKQFVSLRDDLDGELLDWARHNHQQGNTNSPSLVKYLKDKYVWLR
jgi:hypothetical protein